MGREAEAEVLRLAEDQHEMLTRAQAIAAEMSETTLKRRLRPGGLDRIRPGLYRVAGSPVALRSGHASWPRSSR